MKYIRTKDKIFETTRLPLERFSIELTKMIDKQVGLPNPHIEEIEIIKQADTIEDLIIEGDLVKYYDQTTKQYDFSVITKLWQPHQTMIYRVVELYIKQPNGDWRLVARDKGNYKLELV